MTTEEQRLLLGELSAAERQELRQGRFWETSLTSWLDSERPSVIREWLAKQREDFLRHLDSKAWSLESIKQIFPMWDSPQMLDEEMDLDEENAKERPLELSALERKALLNELLP